MWQWFLIVPGVLVLLIALTPYVIGLLTRNEFTATASVEIPQPRESVWDAIGDYQRLPMTGGRCRGCEPIAEESGLPTWVEDVGTTRLTVRTLELTEPQRLVRLVTDHSAPLSTRVEYGLEETGAGTRLSLNNLTIVRKGKWHAPIFRFMMRFFHGPEKSAQRTVTLVAASFDGRGGGEETTA